MTTFVTSDGTLNWQQVLAICDTPQPKFFREHSPHCNNFLDPKFIVLHYTAGGSAKHTVSWFMNPDSKVSAHFTIDRNGDVYQTVSLDKVAWHCGQSVYNSITSLNRFSYGIELANWGALTRNAETGLFSPYDPKHHKTHIPKEYVFDNGITQGESVYRYWEVFYPQQLRALSLLIHSLCATYKGLEVVAHSEVSPGRKIDPGPAFPLQLFKDFAKIAQRL